MQVTQIPGMLLHRIVGITRRILRTIIRPLFNKCGTNVRFNPYDKFTYDTIKIGNDVFIGIGACFSASR